MRDPLSRRRFLSLTTVLGASLGLSGCVNLPTPETHSLRTIDSVDFETTLGGGAGEWPKKEWWLSLNDPQLNRLIALALKDNPGLKVAEARIQKAVALQNQVNAALYASADLEGSVTASKQSYNNGFPKAFVPKGYKDAARIIITGNYTLDPWGKSKAAVKNTRQLAEAEAIDHQAAKINLAVNVAKAYVELGRLYAETDIILKVREGAAKKLELLKLRRDKGLEADDRVILATEDMIGVNNHLAQLEGGMRLTRNLLSALCGQGPDFGLTIERPPTRTDLAVTIPESLGLYLLARRPDVAAARLRAEALSEGLTYARADFYPNVNLKVFWGFQSLGLNHLLDSGSDIGGIGPSVSLPLFRAGQLKANYRAYEADYNLAVEAYNATLLAAVQDVADKGASLQTALSTLDGARAKREAARQGFVIAGQRQKAGLINMIEFLTLDVHYLATVLEQIDQESLALQSKLSLIAALGGGFEPANT